MANLFLYENHIRMIGGMLLLTFAVASGIWWLALPAVGLVYTGGSKFCPVFHMLGINRDRASYDYHLSLLPSHNPEPVYLFNRQGELVFRNKAAKNILPHLSALHSLYESGDITEFNRLDNESDMIGFKEGDKNYLLNFQPIPDSDFIAAFGFDVTQLIRANEEIINTQKELIARMGEIGETRSKETGNHVKRVAEYSRQLAMLMGLPGDEAELLKMASPMHDIGKVAIPDRVLLKPGKLDEEEWEIMKTHASIGHELLSHSERPILQAAAIVAGQHHEKWDGSGYPTGLAGEKIHIYGRITALADVFDALGSERVYKKAWPLEQILELMNEQSGRHFDPQLVKLFQQNLPVFLSIRDEFSDEIRSEAS
jgi:HD-GYP domain-containing protein (c-di-GMP phosphodiesterase class II)